MKKFENTFARFDTMYERDGRTDTSRQQGPRFLCRHRAAKTIPGGTREVYSVPQTAGVYGGVEERSKGKRGKRRKTVECLRP